MVIDVGGGIGSSSMVLAKAYPHLRFVVEDREHVVEIAPSVRTNCPVLHVPFPNGH